MSFPLLNRFRGRGARLMPSPKLPWAPSSGGRTRVLLECPPEQSPSVVSSVLERAGMDVVVCVGPLDHDHCPLAVGEYCSTVQGVDVVVNMLGTNTPERRAVLPAMLDSSPRRPPIVAVLPDSDPVPGVQPIGHRVSGTELVDAVHEALGEAHCPAPWWGTGV